MTASKDRAYIARFAAVHAETGEKFGGGYVGILLVGEGLAFASRTSLCGTLQGVLDAIKTGLFHEHLRAARLIFDDVPHKEFLLDHSFMIRIRPEPLSMDEINQVQSVYGGFARPA